MRNFCAEMREREWTLGCVNSLLAARGSEEVGFTQPRESSFAHSFIVAGQGLAFSLKNHQERNMPRAYFKTTTAAAAVTACFEVS